MRKGIPRSAVVLLALSVGLSIGLEPIPSSSAVPRNTRTVGQVVDERASGPDARAAVNIEEAEFRIDVTSKELRFALDAEGRLDRDLVAATQATSELREETNSTARETLKNAIDGYQHSELPRGLLRADDLTSSMRATALGGAAVSADTESFDAYRDLRKDLEIEESALVDKQARAEVAQAEVERLEQQLSGELEVYGRLQERALFSQSQLVAVQASNRARARGRKQGFFLDTCPVNGPHSFIDSWGFARSGGRRHKGVDILANIGVEIVAPVSGTVTHRSNRVGGRSFHFTTADGNYFYGTHLSAYGKSGQVNAGEVIGYVGDDGNAAGIPHLHFEIHPGGRGNPINPFIDTAAVCSGVQY
ncbi:MAG: M23 family metallopeptidase [Actinomycetota bacterium]